MASRLEGIQQGRNYKLQENKRSNLLVSTEKDLQLENCHAASTCSPAYQIRIEELERLRTNLQAQLKHAEANITRITNERNLLIHLNNSLHASLNSVVPPFHECVCHPKNPKLQELQGKTCRCFFIDEDAKCIECPVPKSMNVTGSNLQTETLCIHQNARTNLGNHHNNYRQDVHTIPSGKVMGDKSSTDCAEHCQECARCGLQLEGHATIHHERQKGLEDITHKGTSSQHAKLKSLMKRRDNLSTAKPKIRNYNHKDDIG